MYLLDNEVVEGLYDMVFPKVVEHFEQRGSKEDVVVHVINIDIQDNQEEATIGLYLPEGEHHSSVIEIQYRITGEKKTSFPFTWNGKVSFGIVDSDSYH
jgi:hypothetical protein